MEAKAPQPAIVATSTPTFGSLEAEQGKSQSKPDQLSTSTTPAPVSHVYTSASDSILARSLAENVVGATTVVDDGGSQRIAAEPNDICGNKNVSSAINLGLLTSEKTIPGAANSMHEQKTPSKSKASEREQISEISEPLPLPTLEGNLAIRPCSRTDGLST